MGRLSRLLLLGLLAAVAMAVATGQAAASRGIGVPGGAITMRSTPLTFTPGGLTLICTVELRGTLPTRIQKVQALPFGSITAGSVTGCNLGVTATLLLGSIVLSYNSFLGTLPNVTGLLFVIESFEVLFRLPLVGGCLYFGDLHALLNAAGTQVTLLNVAESGLLLFASLSGQTCPSPMRVAGSFTMAPAQPLTLLSS